MTLKTIMFFTFIHGYSENNENWIMMDADPVRYTTCCTDSYRVRTVNRKSNGFGSATEISMRVFRAQSFLAIDYDRTLIFSKLLHKFDR